MSGKLLIRVDDFPWVKPEERSRHSIDRFLEFHKTMEKFGFPRYVLGVIPGNCTPQDYEVLRALPITIALHGITHDGRNLNEFESSSADFVHRQIELTSLNMRKYFPVDTYIPPHNVIDEKTVRALAFNGFRRIMGGPGTEPSVMTYAKSQGLDFVYSSEPLEYGRTDEMFQRGSVSHVIRQLDSGSSVCLTFHWTWENNIGFENMDRYFGSLEESLEHRACKRFFS